MRQNARIKVLHVIPTLGSGGAEKQLADVVACADATHYEHVVCHFARPDFFASRIEKAGIRVICLNLKGKRPWMRAALSLFSLIRYERPAVVHAWLFDAILSARLARIVFGVAPRLVTSIQAPDYDIQTIESAKWPAWKMRFLRALDRISLRLSCWAGPAERVVPCSQWLVKYAIDTLGAEESQIQVIYNSFDASQIGETASRGLELRQKLGLDDKNIVLVSVARLDPQKGQDILLRSFVRVAQAVPETVLLLIGGGGPWEASVRELSSHLGLDGRVFFLGKQQEIGAWLNASDIFAFPSRSEGFGTALLEAMAAGLPVVASNVGPIPEIVRFPGITGVLVENENELQLADELTRLAKDPKLRAEMGQAAKEDVSSRFRSDGVITYQWKELYSSMIQTSERSTESTPNFVHP